MSISISTMKPRSSKQSMLCPKNGKTKIVKPIIYDGTKIYACPFKSMVISLIAYDLKNGKRNEFKRFLLAANAFPGKDL